MLHRELEKRKLTSNLNSDLNLEVSVGSNPEFLSEGSAVNDFMNPDRIIVGTSSQIVISRMTELFAPIQARPGSTGSNNLIIMDMRSAELTKYASNAMLACRLSMMNDFSRLAEALGASIDRVQQGLVLILELEGDFCVQVLGMGALVFRRICVLLAK